MCAADFTGSYIDLKNNNNINTARKRPKSTT